VKECKREKERESRFASSSYYGYGENRALLTFSADTFIHTPKLTIGILSFPLVSSPIFWYRDGFEDGVGK